MRRRRLSPEQAARTRRLRNDATFPERLLWSRLRAGQIGGIKFRRQHAIGPYVADFYCSSAALVVELDGRSHDETVFDHDQGREEWLRARGLRVVRFTNDEVIRDVEGVARAIAHIVGAEP